MRGMSQKCNEREEKIGNGDEREHSAIDHIYDLHTVPAVHCANPYFEVGPHVQESRTCFLWLLTYYLTNQQAASTHILVAIPYTAYTSRLKNRTAVCAR